MYNDLIDTIGYVESVDAEVGKAMNAELARQKRNLELIASENIVSPAVMAAMGSVLTNKYAEGYPGKRYYGGCECVDVVENIAIERAKELFGAKFANVQPHSGAQANTAAYFAVLKPGDTVLGMSLADGGHLTHGSPVNLSGKYFNFVSYGLDDETETINYDTIYKLAVKHQPRLIVAGASAYPRAIDFKKLSAVLNANLFVSFLLLFSSELLLFPKKLFPEPYAFPPNFEPDDVLAPTGTLYESILYVFTLELFPNPLF